MDFTNVLNNTYTVILLVVLAVAFVVLALYYGLIHFRVARYKNAKIPQPSTIGEQEWPSVSVVMVAHNEAEYLKESLPYLLEQDYPDFEVVVVDYMSQDDTHFVLRVCSENYPQLKPINFPDDVNMFRGKKYPLSIGIKSAKKDIILLTEPDCSPKEFSWIRQMVCGYMRGASLVEGCSMIRKSKGLLNALQRYECITDTASYIGATLLGNPYTATGRNLSYRRDFFFSHGGFISHYSIADGADDLFVNQNANKGNTAVVVHPDADVLVEARTRFGHWHLDRLHRRITRHNYNWGDKFRLAMYPFAQILFYASWLVLLIMGLFPWQLLAALMALKIVWQGAAFYFLGKRFESNNLTFFSPLFELYFLFANTILYFSTLRKKKNRWR